MTKSGVIVRVKFSRSDLSCCVSCVSFTFVAITRQTSLIPHGDSDSVPRIIFERLEWMLSIHRPLLKSRAHGLKRGRFDEYSDVPLIESRGNNRAALYLLEMNCFLTTNLIAVLSHGGLGEGRDSGRLAREIAIH